MQKANSFVIIIYALACICIQADAEGLKSQTPNKDRIRPYSENPMYWQYKENLYCSWAVQKMTIYFKFQI